MMKEWLKSDIRECWKRQGVFEPAVAMREILKEGGAATEDAWMGALSVYPIDQAVMDGIRRAKSKANMVGKKVQMERQKALAKKIDRKSVV